MKVVVKRAMVARAMVAFEIFTEINITKAEIFLLRGMFTSYMECVIIDMPGALKQHKL